MSLILALLLSASAPLPAVADEEAFTAEMLGRFRTALPGVTLTPKPGDRLAILAEGGNWKDAQFNLGRIYHYCRQASTADCEAAKAEFVGKTTLPPPRMTRESLRLIVRDAEYVGYLRQLEAEDGPGTLALMEPIGEDLFALLASDSADATAVVGEKHLGELGLTRAEAWALGRRQTAAILPPMPTAAQLREGALAFQEYEYLASLLLDLPSWDALAREVGPDLFVTVVSDGFVFVGRLEDGPALAAFRETVAEDCAAQQRCVSPNIYRFRGGRWTIAR